MFAFLKALLFKILPFRRPLPPPPQEDLALEDTIADIHVRKNQVEHEIERLEAKKRD